MHKDLENRKVDCQRQATIESQGNELILSGDWTWQCIAEELLNHPPLLTLKPKKTPLLKINAQRIEHFDSIGAYYLTKLVHLLEKKKIQTEIIHIADNHQALYSLALKDADFSTESKSRSISPFDVAQRIGFRTRNYFYDSIKFFAFVGEVTLSSWQMARTPWKVRWRLIFDIVFSAGYQAVGIICLLAFLIGIVLAYQIGGQLLQYGANIFIVDLLGISLLREFAPLISAIIVAGRSGSAFAAQIGTMKVQEEVDALRTFGISPVTRLVLPRIIGLIIALPLLTIMANIASVFGGMVMSKAYLGLGYVEFIIQFGKSISFDTYMVGLVKTPVFALLIAAIGCYRGLRVRGDSASIGEETTNSVVYSIFLIIIADALFSILFSMAGI